MEPDETPAPTGEAGSGAGATDPLPPPPSSEPERTLDGPPRSLRPRRPSVRAAVGSSWTGLPTEDETPDDAEDDDQALVGVVLSNTYRIVRAIGEGGMGRVFEAVHTRIAGKRFAIKMLHPEMLRHKDVRERFQREAEAAARINHPNVVGVYDVDVSEDGRPFLVCEYLEGEELGDLIFRRERLPVPEAVRITRQLCRALAAAHAQGVVHRDLKPQNVFLTGRPARPDAKVIDFGISRLDGAEGSVLTQTGVILGTPAYMAPEQARGERVDHRADVYALGTILYVALTGEVPFSRTEPQASIAAVLTQEPTRPRALVPDLPEDLEHIVQQAMAKRPEDRFQSMAELHHALAPFDPDLAPDELPPSSRRYVTAAGYGARSREPSQALELRAPEVAGARPLLAAAVSVGALGATLAIAGAVGAVVRLVRGPGGEVRPLETLLIVLAVVCTLATPLYLVARTLQRQIWDNTAKVVETLRVVGGPVVFGAAAYGLGALLGRVLQTMVVGPPWALGGPWWDLALPVVAAGAVVLRARSGARARGGPVQRVGLLGVSVGAAVTVLVAVAVRGADETPERVPPVRPVATAASVATQPTATPPVVFEPVRADPSGDAEMPGPDELEALVAELTQGSAKPLGPLGPVLPEDRYRAVQLSVKLEEDVKRGQLVAALDTLEELLQVDPFAARDEAAVRTLVTMAVGLLQTDSPDGKRLLALLTGRLGSAGVDVLYELLTTRGGTVAARYAERLLGEKALRSRGSEALQVAYDLRMATSCEEKVAHFERAERLGDLRALNELRLLQECVRTSCCLRGDPRVKKAIAAIFDRRRKSQ